MDDDFETLAMMLAACEVLDAGYDSDKRRRTSDLCWRGTGMAGRTVLSPTSTPFLLTQDYTLYYNNTELDGVADGFILHHH